jgi:hypothetical protein
MGNAEADLPQLQGRLPLLGKRATQALSGSVGVVATACKHRETDATRETPAVPTLQELRRSVLVRDDPSTNRVVDVMTEEDLLRGMQMLTPEEASTRSGSGNEGQGG